VFEVWIKRWKLAMNVDGVMKRLRVRITIVNS
jgi:hypothetical protein